MGFLKMVRRGELHLEKGSSQKMPGPHNILVWYNQKRFVSGPKRSSGGVRLEEL